MLMSVTGMTCTGCADTIQEHLKKLPGVFVINVSFKTAKFVVVFHNKILTEQNILDHVNALSFKAELIASALVLNIEAIVSSNDEQKEIEVYLKTVEGVTSTRVGTITKRKAVQGGQKRNEMAILFLIDYDPDCTGARTIIEALQTKFRGIPVVQKKIEDNFQKGMKVEVKRWMNRLIAVAALTLPVIIFAFILPSIDTSKEAIETKVYNGKG